MADVACFFERVVEPAYEFRSFDVDRILVFEPAALDADDETEFLDMLWQVSKRDAELFVLFEVVKLECLKVA